MCKKWWRIFTLSSLVLLIGVAALPPGAETTNQKPSYQAPRKAAEYAPGEVLIKFKGAHAARAIGPSAQAQVLAALPASAKAALKEIKGKVVRVHPLVGVLKVEIPADSTVEQVIEALNRSGTVAYAEPNYKVKAVAPIPDDARFAEQWGLHNTGEAGGTQDSDIDAPEGWDIAKDASSTLVCVIDTGVDYTHVDLSSNMWTNPREIPDDGIDNDGNGWVDDIYGINTCYHNGNPWDDSGHGTHCAGIVGASGNNNTGVSGVAWQTKIMALKFLDEWGSGWTEDAILSMEYALYIKERDGWSHMVWSNSWGGYLYSQALYDSIALARERGVIVVAASGNESMDAGDYPMYPAAYDLPNILSVGASNRWDTMTSFTNFGSFSVDLFAPGEEILSTLPSDGYGYMDGTSMACPYVSGACALAWSKRDTMDWKKIKGLILNGAEDGQVTSAFAAKSVTEGRLNLFNTLQEALEDDPAMFSVSPGKAKEGGTITVAGTGFGTGGTLKFDDTPFPSENITSWTDEQIVATVPAGLPLGFGRLKVTTEAGTSRGASIKMISPPPNDDYRDAALISALPFDQSLDTTEATRNDSEAPMDPDACGGYGNTVWYAYTPESDMRVMADTFGSNYDTVLSVWTLGQDETGTPRFEPVTCNDDWDSAESLIIFEAEAHVTYYFMVAQFGWTDGGDLIFHVDVAPPPFTVDVKVNASGSVNARTGVATISGTATCSQPGNVSLSGELRQKVGRLVTITANFNQEFSCDGETLWSAQLTPHSGSYAGGNAVVSLQSSGCGGIFYECEDESQTLAVKLKSGRAR